MSEGMEPTSTGGGQSTTGQVKDKLQEGAGQLGGQVRETTQQARSQAGERVREQVNQRSTQAAEQANSIADVIRRTSSTLREEGREGAANVAEQAAERTQRLGGYLQDADADRILRDAEDFARRQPWVVVAGGALLGLVASRFLKASSARRYRSGDGDMAWQPRQYPAIEPGYATAEPGYVSPAERIAPTETPEIRSDPDTVAPGVQSREEL